MTMHPKSLSSTQMLIGVDAEIRRCLDLLLRIEDEVLPIVAQSMTPSLRAALQDIDLLSQCLDDISRCIKGIADAETVPRALNAESILSRLRLQDMRLRLEGVSYDARKLTEREEMFVEPKAPPSADVQLF